MARLSSLALSTRASFLRQLGRAPRRQGMGRPGLGRRRFRRHAGTDALVGLAADALGVGRFALSARLLRARRRPDGRGRRERPGRLPVRLAWVSAELAMFTGDGAAAVGHAERAVELRVGPGFGATRREIPGRPGGCAAAASATSRRPATVADAALETTERLGLVPLSWALACLLADIGSAVALAAADRRSSRQVGRRRSPPRRRVDGAVNLRVTSRSLVFS